MYKYVYIYIKKYVIDVLNFLSDITLSTISVCEQKTYLIQFALAQLSITIWSLKDPCTFGAQNVCCKLGAFYNTVNTPMLKGPLCRMLEATTYI